MNHIQVKIEEGAPRTRIDVYVAKNLGLATRSQLKERIAEIRMDGKTVKPSRLIEPGKVLEIFYRPREEPTFQGENLPLKILYEDNRVVVLDKPAGMVVHPGCGVYSGTLVQGLLYHIQNLKDAFPEEPIRPGIVHRLDRDTSGVIITAKDSEALEFLSAQFRKKTVRKLYLALVKGSPPRREGILRGYISRDPIHRKRFRILPVTREEAKKEIPGKYAVTRFQVLKTFSWGSFVLLQPHTGRTHQLRVQLQALGCPIWGDPIYSRAEKLPFNVLQKSLFLHAYLLEVVLPGETIPRRFYAPLPERFKVVLRGEAQNLGF
ncbi:MAG TPA: RluA family pseudouridine synthase [Spirochaetales bacterium]|nr:RluA family pseudouridine synthase [Spirochaetales bacterium]